MENPGKPGCCFWGGFNFVSDPPSPIRVNALLKNPLCGTNFISASFLLALCEHFGIIFSVYNSCDWLVLDGNGSGGFCNSWWTPGTLSLLVFLVAERECIFIGSNRILIETKLNQVCRHIEINNFYISKFLKTRMKHKQKIK